MDTVPIQNLKPGDVFEDKSPHLDAGRDNVYRFDVRRRRTIIAENVMGIRRSFNLMHLVKPASVEVWNQLSAQTPKGIAPAMPKRGEGEKSAEVA